MRARDPIIVQDVVNGIIFEMLPIFRMSCSSARL